MLSQPPCRTWSFYAQNGSREKKVVEVCFKINSVLGMPPARAVSAGLFLTSWCNFSNFSWSSTKYREVTRPFWDLSRQSLTSSTNWCWMKPSTPSANGSEMSGEQWVMMSNKRSSIWAVACREGRHRKRFKLSKEQFSFFLFKLSWWSQMPNVGGLIWLCLHQWHQNL